MGRQWNRTSLKKGNSLFPGPPKVCLEEEVSIQPIAIK